jgi:hypothetical protein
MKPTKKPSKPAADAVETFGGDYHRFESVFQPRKEPPAPSAAAEKARTRSKKPRKPSS